jgi:hypothetical protein
MARKAESALLYGERAAECSEDGLFPNLHAFRIGEAIVQVV